MQPKDIAKLVRFARKNGLKRLKCGDIEFEFTQGPMQEARIPRNAPGEPITTDERPPSEDEFLLWSTPHFDQLRAEREKGSKERN